MNFPRKGGLKMDNKMNDSALFNVLSLEDSDLDFEIISEQLIHAGYNLNISRAVTENEFTSLIRINEFDIILADYNLPQFDAFEALKLSQEYCPDIPFICVSGSIGEIKAIELLKHGATDYVLKDRLERLPSAVQRALDETKEKNTLKKAQEALRDSESKLNYAQEIAHMGNWDYYFETNKIYWSKNMYKIQGYDPFETELTYDDFFHLVHPDDKYLIDLNLQKIIETKRKVSFDFRYILSNGQIMWVQNNIMPVFYDDQLKELHGVTINITEKKIAEQELIKAKENAEASNRLKTAFMNNISHEIRTPLNGILGFSQILADPDFPTEEKEKYCLMLNNSSERLLNTITNFMDISLLTSGNQKIYKKEIEVENLIRDICGRFNEACNGKKLTLIIKTPKQPYDFKIYTDGELLSKILNQLIDNAVKFTSHGQISIGFEKKDDKFDFFVKDSGIGISEENKLRIFGDFNQLDSETTRKFQGTGLGLSIAKGLTELLGGKIWMNSEKGKGSTFHISIPLFHETHNQLQGQFEQNY